MDNRLLIETPDELIDCWSTGKVSGHLLKH